MSYNSTLEELCACYKFRDGEIKQLIAYLSDGTQWPWHCVYVYGHPATGKSLIIDAVVEKMKLAHIKVNLVECYSSQVLYELILQQLDNQQTASCDNMCKFVQRMKQIIAEKYASSTICLILEKAEKLRDMEKHIMPGILRLREIIGSQLCVILVSEITWKKLMQGYQFTECVKVHFTEYNRQQIESILTWERETDSRCSISQDMLTLYRSYLSLLITLLYPACRNLRELSYLAHHNFSQFCKPIEDGELTVKDVPALWRRSQPQLAQIRNTVFLRESTYNWQQQQQDTDTGDNTNAIQNSVISSGDEQLKRSSYVELPYYTKYLVIAAYLASYNPVSYDKQLFVKHSVRARRKKPKTKHDKDNCHINGPKAFELNRLLAIFATITEIKVEPTICIYSQITTLVNLRLLERCSGENEISNPKYKCLANMSFTENIAKHLEFELKMYLYDDM